MAGAGKRTERVTFERLTPGEDEYGSPTDVWAPLGAAKAEVFWGSGNEQREAARQGGSQSATFRVLSTELTRGVRVADRLTTQDGAAWDIKATVPRARSKIEISAVRAA